MTLWIRIVMAGALSGTLLSSQAPPLPAQAAPFSVQAPQAGGVPEAASILDRYVEVTGGRAAYEKIHSEIMTGTVEFAAQGLKGKMARYSAPPDQEYSIVELEGIGSLESGISGEIAWEKSVLLGPRLKSGEEKEQALREARFNTPIEWRALYPQTATAGMQVIDDEECYEVILTPDKGKPEHQFFSRRTGLLMRTTAVAASKMGDVPVEVDFGNYQKFGGVLFPTVSKQRAGSQELSITIEQVRVNETLPADRFALPAEIAALVHKEDAPARAAP